MLSGPERSAHLAAKSKNGAANEQRGHSKTETRKLVGRCLQQQAVMKEKLTSSTLSLRPQMLDLGTLLPDLRSQLENEKKHRRMLVVKPVKQSGRIQ